MKKTFTDMYVGGRWWPTENTFVDMNPSDDTLWAEVPDVGTNEVQSAIDSANHAFEKWAEVPFNQRAHFMIKIAEVFEKRKMDIVSALQGEAGGWFGKGMFEASYVPEIFHAAAAMNYAAIGEVIPSEFGKLSMAIRRPMGVVSVISPWNFPTLLTARGIAFALSAGNTVVLKPSEETPYCGGLLFAEIFEEAGVPGGVLNVITCSRDNVSAVGEEMVEHPLVKGISFTGSTAVGREIAARAGAHLKKCCVELGGKDALIICDDADMDRASGAANFGSFMHQGQICMSVEKILVQESVLPEFLERFKERASKLKVGDTTKDKSHVIGPLINDRQVARVKSQMDDAVAKGADIVLGGKVDGRFVEPTIVTGVTSDMTLYRDETFGPVVSVIPFDTDEQAVAIANDTEYGLSSGVITKDEYRGLEIAQKLETGMCHINCSSVNDEPHAPFGGSKSSGVGRHGGRWATDTFTETRWITLERGGRGFPPGF
ncbi:MAG: aldehyde dehydrogenase family protein [Arenicellales bacterium]|jgi:aldehyde dehydrogenase (NAD+)|nr:aldehyde dehydrogenase family protein [Arenicellales bacterium]MDP7524184.1 aldehyde dehydrogenase family protein [Arenicellales bacterium]HJL56884.1 aldehyde dehydrogenase family protein [Arenicellales bacterium]|tara:strand:+ start:5799 stop:7259 length:1461 start_codon:yes stop_codon:yes gene_type:complete